MKKKKHSLETWKNILQKSATSSKDALVTTLKEHDALVEIFWKEIVESAEKSIEIITKFLKKKPNVNIVQMNDICKTLEESRSAFYRDFNSFPDNLSKTAYEILEDNKAHVINNKHTKNAYQILQKYFSKDSLIADIFCWLGIKSQNYSSVRWAIGIFSLLWIDKALFIDLFNQENEIEKNKVYDKNRWYNYIFDIKQGQTIMKGEREVLSDNKRSFIYPDFDSFSIKLDALNALKAMPDNSLDGIMINNVDYEIVQKQWYDALLRAEVKRVVKNKWIVFWYGTVIWPSNENFVLNGGRGEFRAFENKKK